MEKTLAVASKLGYILFAVRVESFKEYKDLVKQYPILIGFEQFDGMVTPTQRDLIGPTGDKTGSRHVMLSLGRNPNWLVGRYSVFKNSAGPDWGDFGEVSIMDGDLKELWERGGVEAWAVVK